MTNNIKNIYRQIPKSVWILTLLQLFFVARTTFFATGSRNVGDYSVTMNSSTSLIIVIIFLSVIVILKEFRYFKMANKNISRLITFYCLCLVSFIWGGGQIVTIFKATEVLCNIYLMYIIASKIGNIKSLLLYIIILSTIMTYMDVINCMQYFGFGFSHTNTYSMSAMIGFLLSIQAIKYNIFTSKEIRIFLILNFLAIIGGTSSATYISFIVGIVLVYSSNKKGLNMGKAIFTLIFAIIAYYLFSDIIFDFIFQGKSDQEIETGTGRKDAFIAAINAWKDSPIFGHGYIVGQRNLGRYGLGFNALSAHNTYLGILVDTGIVGIVIFINFLLSWIYNLIKKSKNNIYATMFMPTLIACLVNCLAFPAIGADWTYVGSLIFLMYIMTNLYIKNNNNIVKS